MLSLFSGVGGFDCAAQRAGIETIAFCEKEPKRQELLRSKFPNIPIYDDVRYLNKRTLRRLGRIDLICGGFPCQDVSLAGQRKGLAGSRSGLWFEFQRIIHEAKASYVVIENVPGLLSSHEGRDFQIVLGGLIGYLPSIPATGWGTAGIAKGKRYNVSWRVLDARYFGVAQRRRRVFIVASLGSGGCAEVLFEPESGLGYTPQSRQTGEDIAAPLTAGTGANSRPAGRRLEDDWNIVAGTATKGERNDNGTTHDKLVIAKAVPTSTERYDASVETFVVTPLTRAPYADNGSQEDKLIVAPTLTKTDLAEQSSRQPVVVAPFNDKQIGSGFNKSRIDIGAPSPTLNHNGMSAMIDKRVRRLTPLETNRLQGFPDGWTSGFSDSQQYQMMGDAVEVNTATWILRRVKRIFVDDHGT